MDASDRVRAALLEAARSAAPPPDTTIVEWSEQHRILGHSSRLSGLYRARITPFWREPMALLSPSSPIQRVVIQKAAQMGCSELALNTAAFYLAAAPSPVLYCMPTILTATRFSRQRVSEMLALAPALQELTSTPRGGERSNSVLMKSLRNGALLMLTGTNAPSMLRSLPIKILILDEVDAFPADTGNEGDPIGLAAERCESYGSSKKILCISTPTLKSASRIEALYLATDQRKYFVPCPSCGNWITLEFGQLYRNTVICYRCQLCSGEIHERDKPAMIESGEWRATAVSRNPLAAGFHVNQLFSAWTSWSDLVARKEAAVTPEAEQVFVNCSLALTWEPPAATEIPASEALAARAEPYPEGTVPAGGCFLTCGVDCQMDRLELEVVSWGPHFESWSVGYYVLHGDITEPPVWTALDELLRRSWPHASGMPLQLQATCIDSGFSPQEVNQFTRPRHSQRVYSTKGLSLGFGKPIWPRKASWDKNKFAVYLISADEAKTWVANRMRIPAPGPGYMHAPLSRDRVWYEQITSERLILAKGQRKWVKQPHARNEAFDARTLAVAALHSRLLAGVDLNQWCAQFEGMLQPVNGPPAAPASNVIRSKFVHG
jgi:phage terminase large subunit GpA-like protein